MERSKSAGLTLFELLCTILILIVVSGLALPSYAHWRQYTQQKLLRDTLYHHLLHARSISIDSGRPVEVCGSKNGQQCDNDWRHGWLIRHPDTAEVLRTHSLDGGWALHWTGFNSTLQFLPSGISPTGNGHFQLCGPHAISQWQVIVNRQGRVRWTNEHERC